MEDTLKYYEILGLEPGATEEEIKQAYRDLVRVWHPDRFEGDSRLQEKAQQKLKEINLAYEFLKLHWYTPLPRDEQTYSEREDHYEEYYEEEQDNNRKDWVPASDIGKNVNHWYWFRLILISLVILLAFSSVMLIYPPFKNPFDLPQGFVFVPPEEETAAMVLASLYADGFQFFRNEYPEYDALSDCALPKQIYDHYDFGKVTSFKEFAVRLGLDCSRKIDWGELCIELLIGVWLCIGGCIFLRFLITMVTNMKNNLKKD